MFLLKYFNKSIPYSVIFILLFGAALPAQQSDTLYVLQTTDVHGHIRAYAYFTDQAADYGLAKVYTRIIDYRRQHKNVTTSCRSDTRKRASR
jgi:2',3'-cyclic-nucleotide 2'-phosphodiesterase/3'-nucleotidase